MKNSVLLTMIGVATLLCGSAHAGDWLLEGCEIKDAASKDADPIYKCVSHKALMGDETNHYNVTVDPEYITKNGHLVALQEVEIRYSVLKSIMDYMQVDSLEALKDALTYKGHHAYGSVEDLENMMQLAEQSKQEQPLYEMIDESALKSLAKFECPKFEDIKAKLETPRREAKQVIFRAYHRHYFKDSYHPSAKWFDAFNSKLKEMTKGEIWLEKGDFKVNLLGPGNPLVLTDGKRKLKIVLGPYSTPFEVPRD